MENFMNRLQRLCAVLASSLLLSACGQASTGSAKPDGAAPATIHIAETAGLPAAFLQYGVERGLFKNEGLDLVVDSSAGGAAALPGVVGGSTQLAGSNVFTDLLAKAKGLPVQIVASNTFSTDTPTSDYSAVLVAKDSAIADARELAGKTIAVNTLGNVGEVTIKTALEQKGVDISGIKFLELGFPDMIPALEAGRVDAVWTIEPFVTRGIDNGSRPVLWPFVESRPNLMVGSVVASESYIKENPEIIAAFQRGLTATMDFVNKDTDSFRASLPKLANMSEAAAKQIVLPVYKTSTAADLESMEFVVKQMEKYGVLSTKVDVSKLLLDGIH
jgi:NitT/TauT family transport system substrate-binding protein